MRERERLSLESTIAEPCKHAIYNPYIIDTYNNKQDKSIPLLYHGQKQESNRVFQRWQKNQHAHSCIAPQENAYEQCVSAASHNHSIPGQA